MEFEGIILTKRAKKKKPEYLGDFRFPLGELFKLGETDELAGWIGRSKQVEDIHKQNLCHSKK